MAALQRLAPVGRWVVALLVAVAAAIGGLSVGSTASASTYPPAPAILSVSDRNLPPSTPFDATVTGCRPGETVTFYLPGRDPISTTCGSNGVATVTFISPDTPGVYEVTAVLENGTVLRINITVTDDIPRTGSDSTSAGLLLGAGLVAFGGLFVLVARLRRRETAIAAA